MIDFELNLDTVVKLMNLVLTLNAFDFNNEIFCQIHGTSMGTPVAPTYANIFMTWLETNFMLNLTKKPFVYKRYLDDIFMIWPHSINDLDEFVSKFNNFHETIELTAEFSDSKINFLDVTVQRNNSKLITTLYKKPTHKNQYLHFESAHTRDCKTGIPNSQVVRLRRICSDDTDYEEKIDELIGTLGKRKYPKQLLHATKNKSKSIQRSDTIRQKKEKI